MHNSVNSILRRENIELCISILVPIPANSNTRTHTKLPAKREWVLKPQLCAPKMTVET